jgi:methionine synthase I (cobalamin-dependent)
VASAGLVTALFVPDHNNSSPPEMIQGVHKAFLTLGAFTILSTLTFNRLKSGDGRNVSQQREVHSG